MPLMLMTPLALTVMRTAGVIVIHFAQGPGAGSGEEDAAAKAANSPDDEAVEVLGDVDGRRSVVLGDGVECVGGHGFVS